MNKNIPLLFTVDENYIYRLQVVLTSIYLNNQNKTFDIYLMHNNIDIEKIKPVMKQCNKYNYSFYSMVIEDEMFSNAPITKQYPKEMYYRLIAHKILPETLDKIIYLDPDILVINPIEPLWKIDLGSNLFAAAAHSSKTPLVHNVNKIRLKTEHNYYNSGVLVINLKLARKEIVVEDLFAYVNKHSKDLILPVQDMLNSIFGSRILPLDDTLWNYDARDYNKYYIYSNCKYDLDWVFDNTSILHFCGKSKPWKPGYLYRFGTIYKHYDHLTKVNML